MEVKPSTVAPARRRLGKAGAAELPQPAAGLPPGKPDKLPSGPAQTEGKAVQPDEDTLGHRTSAAGAETSLMDRLAGKAASFCDFV